MTALLETDFAPRRTASSYWRFSLAELGFVVGWVLLLEIGSRL